MTWISQCGALVIDKLSVLEGVQCACWEETNRVDSMAGIGSEYTWVHSESGRSAKVHIREW